MLKARVRKSHPQPQRTSARSWRAPLTPTISNRPSWTAGHYSKLQRLTFWLPASSEQYRRGNAWDKPSLTSQSVQKKGCRGCAVQITTDIHKIKVPTLLIASHNCTAVRPDIPSVWMCRPVCLASCRLNGLAWRRQKVKPHSTEGSWSTSWKD